MSKPADAEAVYAGASTLTKARAYVAKHAPYFSHTLYAMMPTPVENLTALVGGPLAVTAKLVLLYDPAWIAQEKYTVVAFGLAHEILHDQLRHIARGQAYLDKARFNRAGDLFINGLQKKQTRSDKSKGTSASVPLWDVPDWVLLPEKYGFPEGKTADEYYRLLEQYEKEDPDKKQGKCSDGDKKPGVGCGKCGGIAGNPLSKELEAKYDATKGRSEMECKNIARVTAGAMKKYMEGEGRDNSPGDWSTLFEMSEEVYQVPWGTELANVMRTDVNRIRSGGHDYSMRRPSPRSYLRGWPLPGLVGYEPEIAFVIDSSGSMGREQIGSALRVCADVMRQTGIQSAWFMEADAAAQRHPIRVTANDLMSIELKGGGGTDFTPALEYMQEFRPKVSLVLYMTDGDGAAPAEEPEEFSVVWCVVPSPYGRVPAAWGKLIVMDDHAELRPLELDEEYEEDEED